MVQSLYSAPRAAYLGAVILAACILYTGLVSGGVWIFSTAIFAVFATLIRIVDVELFRRVDMSNMSCKELRGSETRNAITAALVLGSISAWFAAIFLTEAGRAFDLMAVLLIMGYLVSVTGRNHASKRVINFQLAVTIPFVVPAIAIGHGGVHIAALPLVVIFFMLLLSMSSHLRAQLYQASLTSIENEELAGRFHSALNNMAHGLCMIDDKGRVVVTNTNLVKMFGEDILAEVSEISQRGLNQSEKNSLFELFKPCVEQGYVELEEAQKTVRAMEKSRNENVPKLVQMTTLSGRVFEVTCSPMSTGGGVALFEDITEQRRVQAQINHLAHYDSLTGLMNRSSMRQELTHTLKNLRDGEKCAVLFIDLDQFKEVNDTLGHPVGDALLCEVANRISSLLPERSTLGRLGGDEFIILTIGYANRDALTALSKQIITKLADPFMINGQQIRIGGSIGIATAPRDSQDTDTLIKKADVALYCSKAAGRGTWNFFNQEMEEAALERRRLENDLHLALQRNEIEVYFQPLVSIENLKITTCEALVRWRHPDRGLVSPAEFIPIAEEIGLIGTIGKYVLQKACMEAASWTSNTRVAVNVSALQFRDNVTHIVEDALKQSRLSPTRLEIEITESVFLQSSQQTKGELQTLRNLGVRIALDDFGTGYSSLSYLHAFPLDKVKLDQSFVLGVERNDDAKRLLNGVIQLCSTLDLSIAVEGIETNEQLQIVQDTGLVKEGQGFLFGPPIAAHQMATFLSVTNNDRPFESLSINASQLA